MGDEAVFRPGWSRLSLFPLPPGTRLGYRPGHSPRGGLLPLSERLLTAAEFGELLGLSAGTVLDRFQRGDLPGFRLFGRKGGPVRFRRSEIEALLEAWKAGAGGEAPTTPLHPPGVVSAMPTTPNLGGEHAR
jgi:excisionase family DNA binding protein